MLSNELFKEIEKEIEINGGVMIYNLMNNTNTYNLNDGSIIIEIESVFVGMNIIRFNKLQKIKKLLWKKDMFSFRT